MTTFNQNSVFASLLLGMKRGRSFSRVLKSLPKSIRVFKAEGKGDAPTVVVEYYSTNIVTVYPDRVVLNNGGWPTPSTRRYVNAALHTLFPSMNMGLFQKNYDQFFSYYDTVVPFNRNLTFNIVNGELVTY